MLWAEFREWIVPLIAVGTLLWQGFTFFRRNVVKPEDLRHFATTDNLVSFNKVLQDQVDEGDKALRDARHEIALLKKDIETLPKHEAVEDLRKAVSELTAVTRELKVEVKSLDDKVDGQSVVTARIEQHLLNQVG